MAKITYIEHDGTPHELDLAPGTTVRDGAIDNDVPGIDGDCGGNCACATCHVYVDPAWLSKTGERSEMEQSLLEFADGMEENSRLACQIEMSGALDGLVVRMPKSQH